MLFRTVGVNCSSICLSYMALNSNKHRRDCYWSMRSRHSEDMEAHRLVSCHYHAITDINQASQVTLHTEQPVTKNKCPDTHKHKGEKFDFLMWFYVFTTNITKPIIV